MFTRLKTKLRQKFYNLLSEVFDEKMKSYKEALHEINLKSQSLEKESRRTHKKLAEKLDHLGSINLSEDIDKLKSDNKRIENLIKRIDKELNQDLDYSTELNKKIDWFKEEVLNNISWAKDHLNQQTEWNKNEFIAHLGELKEISQAMNEGQLKLLESVRRERLQDIYRRELSMIVKRSNNNLKITNSLLNLLKLQLQKEGIPTLTINKFNYKENIPVKISILTTCYNYGRFLRDNFNSIASQKDVNYEVILVNDASIDNTDQVINDLIKEFNFPITYVNSYINNGGAGALNIALDNASGEFIYILEADDMLNENVLKQYVDKAESENADLIYTDFALVFPDQDEKIEKRNKVNLEELKILKPINPIPMTTLLRKSSVLEAGGFRKNYVVQGMEDYELWLKMYLTGKKFSYLPIIGWKYRRGHESNFTISNIDAYSETLGYIKQEIFEFAGVELEIAK